MLVRTFQQPKRLFLIRKIMEWPSQSAAAASQTNSSNQQQQNGGQSSTDEFVWISADREIMDFVEIATLCVLITFGTLLNSLAFARLLRYSRSPPCPGAKSLLGAGGSFLFYMNSFTLLKFNLAITDFAILLVHALGKLIWLLSYRWLFGDVGCRLYQFLSAFTYYSNSNVVVAIGLDRLKVVYSSRVQGTVSSIRRVRLFLAIAWALAFICALPQLFFWTAFELKSGWSQCTTIWQIAEHLRINPDDGTSTTTSGSSIPFVRHWSASPQIQLYYELLHQAAVFVIPFISLFASYLLIVLRVLRYTFQPNSASSNNYNSYSSLIGQDNWSAAEESGRKSARGSLRLSWRLRGFGSSYFFQKLHLFTPQKGTTTTAADDRASPDCLAVPGEVQVRLYAAPPPSPNASNEANSTAPNRAAFPFTSDSNQPSRKGSDVLLVSNRMGTRPFGQVPRKLSAEIADNGSRLSHVAAHPKRCSLNVLPSLGDERHNRHHHQQQQQSHHLLLSSSDRPSIPNCGQMAKHRYSVGKPSLGSAGANSPIWRRQLRSKVFLRALLIVAAHCAFWLPYNLLNLLRFADESLYSWLVEKGALLVEDLIVMNAMINPILYGYGK